MIGPKRFWLKCKGLLVRGSIPLAVISFLGCTSTPVRSLCVLDFIAQKCWVDKKNDVGYTFAEMTEQNDRCIKNKQVPCWYSVDSNDLIRIIDGIR